MREQRNLSDPAKIIKLKMGNRVESHLMAVPHTLCHPLCFLNTIDHFV